MRGLKDWDWDDGGAAPELEDFLADIVVVIALGEGRRALARELACAMLVDLLGPTRDTPRPASVSSTRTGGGGLDRKELAEGLRVRSTEWPAATEAATAARWARSFSRSRWRVRCWDFFDSKCARADSCNAD